MSTIFRFATDRPPRVAMNVSCSFIWTDFRNRQQTTVLDSPRQRRNEGHFLFNDALNTFYLRLYGVIHMVKDHSDSERGNPLPPHGRLFPISSKGSFICNIIHTTAFVTPVVEHWLEREIAQWVHPMKDRSDDPSYHQDKDVCVHICQKRVLQFDP